MPRKAKAGDKIVRGLKEAIQHAKGDAMTDDWATVTAREIEETSEWNTREGMIAQALRAARTAALDEAADIADSHASIEGIAQRIALEIRALASGEKIREG